VDDDTSALLLSGLLVRGLRFRLFPFFFAAVVVAVAVALTGALEITSTHARIMAMSCTLLYALYCDSRAGLQLQ
jgi:uncharacterized membrane protein